MSEMLDAIWTYSLYTKELSAVFLCVLLTLRLKKGKRDKPAMELLLIIVGALFLMSYLMSGILGVI